MRLTRKQISELPVISTANEENDDWMQKSNPEAYKEERRIHEEIAAKLANKSGITPEKKKYYVVKKKVE